MNHPHHYHAYGLRITSELPCPELRASAAPHATPDVIIRLGRVPSSLPNPQVDDGFSQVQPNAYLLRLSDIASYYVTDGREIVVQPNANCAFDLIRLYLFSQCFGVLLHQRHQLILHASAVTTKKGALLFIGPSGSGKSTLAAGFMNAGYQLLAEDLCAIDDSATNGFRVMSGMAQLRLWDDAIQQLGHDKSRMRQVWHKENKHSRLLDSEVATGARPLLAIYLLNSAEINQVTITPLSMPEKAAAILNNIFRAEYVNALGVQAHQFKQAAQLIHSTNIQQLTRPNSYFSVSEQIKQLQQAHSC